MLDEKLVENLLFRIFTSFSQRSCPCSTFTNHSHSLDCRGIGGKKKVQYDTIWMPAANDDWIMTKHVKIKRIELEPYM